MKNRLFVPLMFLMCYSSSVSSYLNMRMAASTNIKGKRRTEEYIKSNVSAVLGFVENQFPVYIS